MLLGLLTLLLCVSDVEREANAHFNRGVTLAAKQDYAAALAEFEEAYRMAPAWQVLFNLGVVRTKLGEPVAALEAFEKYLAQGGEKVPRERAKQVEQELAGLRREVGELVVRVADAAVIEVDGLVRATTPIYVLPGKHVVVAKREGREARAEVELHKGDRVVVALVIPEEAPPPKVVVLTPEPEVAAKPAPVAVAPAVVEAPPTPWYQRWYVWTIAGVVVAGTVTAVAIAAKKPGYDVRIDVPSPP